MNGRSDSSLTMSASWDYVVLGLVAQLAAFISIQQGESKSQSTTIRKVCMEANSPSRRTPLMCICKCRGEREEKILGVLLR